MHAGRVEAIHIAPGESAPMEALASVRAIAGRGLEGDRYATRRGHYSANTEVSRQITLIEVEVLADLAAGGIVLAPGQSRRNLTTSGIRLNDLVGRRFSVGPVECLGTRLCEPCVYLSELVGEPLVAPLVHRGGLRADILTDGEIAIGDAIAALTWSMVPEPAPAASRPDRNLAAAAVGAASALVLDGLLVAALAVLAIAGFSPAGALLLGAVSGLVVAPVVGWRYGAAAARSGLDWTVGALVTAIVVGIGVWAAYVIAIAVVAPPWSAGSSAADFLVIALVESVIYVGIFTALAALPAGFVWRAYMQRWGRGSVRTLAT